MGELSFDPPCFFGIATGDVENGVNVLRLTEIDGLSR